MTSNASLAQRFWAKVAPIASMRECWLWTASTNADGYGKLGLGRGNVLAHRVAWRLAFGYFPVANCLHKCDVPSCVNPFHLFLGSQRDNMVDKTAKGRNARGEQHGSAKLQLQQVQELRARRLSGESVKTLSASFGVGQAQVRRICKGERWR